jgi:selenocysteine-specific elongation factor
MDAKLYLLSRTPEVLVNRQRVRVHMGTMEIMGRVILLDTPEQKPGSESLVQLRLEKKGTAGRLDRFVVRRYSPQITIGGGMILDPNARVHKRFDESNIKKLRTLESESPSEVIETKLLSFTEPGMKIDRLRLETNLAEPELEKILNDLESEDKIIIAGEKKQRWVIHRMIFRQIAVRTLEVLDQFHKENPFRSGISKAELKEKAAGRLEDIVWEKVVVELAQNVKIKVHDNVVSNYNFQINLSPGDSEALRRFEKIILEERFNTTNPAEWANKTKLPINDIDKWFAYLLEQGKILRLEGAICFHMQNVENLREKLIDFLRGNKKITISEFKDLIESSRKYAVPLLEYFDEQGLTVREGDFRVLGENET